MSITEAIKKIESEIPKSVCLVAVSKTKPDSAIMEAYDHGQRDFGENKVQDLCDKYERLPKDIKWHFIGHLQRNKVKYLVDFVHLIHGVDSLRLLKEINKRAGNVDKKVDCLLQIFIADEETKFGLDVDESMEMISGGILNELPNVNIRGLMGMATNTDDMEKVAKEFRKLKTHFYEIKGIIQKPDFDILSMGMTNDYQIAVKEGSNMVRIGSLIFGARG